MFRVFAKDLKSVTLADIRLRISDNLEVLRAETETSAQASRMLAQKASIGWARVGNNRSPTCGRQRRQNDFSSQEQGRTRQTSQLRRNNNPGSNRQVSPTVCQLCLTAKRPSLHSIASCFFLDQASRKALIRATRSNTEDQDYSEDKEEFIEDGDDNYVLVEGPRGNEIEYLALQDRIPGVNSKQLSNKNISNYSQPLLARINSAVTSQCSESTQSPYPRLRVYDSPILACSHGKDSDSVIYIVIDCGATTSMITVKKANTLMLQIEPTALQAVQVDGKTKLQVKGEVHTQFRRGTTTLHFSALIVNKMGTNMIGGTNFIIENDLTLQMSKKSIKIGNSTMIQLTPTILALDALDTRQ